MSLAHLCASAASKAVSFQAPYQTPDTQCFPQAWDKWWQLWLLLMSWSHRGGGWQSWALLVLPLHLCCAQRTCAQTLLNGWIELRPTLKIRLRQIMDRSYATVLGLCRLQILCGPAGLWVADSQKSTTSLWGQLLTHETAGHFPFPLQSLPTEPLSKATQLYALSWSSQGLHWKKGHHCAILWVWRKAQWFSFCESWKVFQILNCWKTSNPPHDLIFKGTDLIPRRQW